MIFLSGIKIYLVASAITASVAFLVYFIENNLKAKIILITTIFYICLPAIMVIRFFLGRGQLGKKRKEMSVSRQMWLTLVILLFTYWWVAQIIQNEKRQRPVRRARINRPTTAPTYKRVLASSTKRIEVPIEQRLLGFLQVN